jgi:hypothetical protein
MCLEEQVKADEYLVDNGSMFSMNRKDVFAFMTDFMTVMTDLCQFYLNDTEMTRQ